MKQDLRVIKTQKRLRHALFTLLKAKSLESIKVAELCRLAKVNRGTFYSHYDDVHGVFKKYLEEIVEDLRQSYEEPYHSTKFRIQNLEADMIKIFHHVKKHQDFYQIIFDEHIPMVYYYLLFDTVKLLIKKSLDCVHQEIEPDIQIGYLVSYQTNAILGILIEWHRCDYKTPIQDLNQQLIAIISITNLFSR